MTVRSAAGQSGSNARGGAPFLHPAFWRSQEQFITKQTGTLPREVAALLREAHASRIGQLEPGNGSPVAFANRRLSSEAHALKQAHVHDAYTEDEIRAHAENYSRLCARMSSLESRQSFALYVGVEPPNGRTMTREGKIARLECPRWWRRQLRKAWTRASEDAMRELGIVRRGRAPYASDQAVRLRAAQRRRGREFLESCVLVNEISEQLPLIEVAERSIANPKIRRGEFMTRARGFEEIARDLGHAAIFVTVTAPSAYHAQLAKGGTNPSWQRFTVRAAQAWLCKMWARSRAKLKRLSIQVYGFRIAEPHHDGTPHWHMLLFVAPHNAETLCTVLRGHWLSEYGQEAGANEHRVKFEHIDASKGSATGYVAKYVAKNIDGAGSIGDAEDAETGAPVIEGIARVDAWASVHGIRQFQQIGGPPVGLWREARRLREVVEDPDIERAAAAADMGDWRAFWRAITCGQVNAKPALKLWKDPEPIPFAQPVYQKNAYGEDRQARVIGLKYCSARVITRPHDWRIERCAASDRADCSGSSGERGSETRRACGRGTSGEASSVGFSGSERAPRASDLGPVAITVRGFVDSATLPAHDEERCEYCAAERAQSRGDPP